MRNINHRFLATKKSQAGLASPYPQTNDHELLSVCRCDVATELVGWERHRHNQPFPNPAFPFVENSQAMPVYLGTSYKATGFFISTVQKTLACTRRWLAIG